MDECQRELVNFHLTGNRGQQILPSIHSTLVLALTDIAEIRRQGTALWMAGIGCMVVLNQLGNAYRRSKRSCKTSGIKAALELFSTLDAIDRHALHALRCCWVHAFSLEHIDQAKKNKKHFYFSIYRGGNVMPIFQHAARAWDGTKVNKTKDTVTLANLDGIFSVTEGVFSTVKFCWERGELELAPGLTPESLHERYSVSIGAATRPS